MQGSPQASPPVPPSLSWHSARPSPAEDLALLPEGQSAGAGACPIPGSGLGGVAVLHPLAGDQRREEVRSTRTGSLADWTNKSPKLNVGGERIAGALDSKLGV